MHGLPRAASSWCVPGFDQYSNLLEQHLDSAMHQFSLSPDIWENTWRHTPRATSLQTLLFLSTRNVFTPSHPVSNLRTVDCLVSSAGHHALHSHHRSQSVCFHQLPVRVSAFLLGLQLRLLKLDVCRLGMGEPAWDSRDIHMDRWRAAVTVAPKVTDGSIRCLL